MAEGDKGTKVTGHPSLQDIDPADVIMETIGKVKPPQTQNGSPAQPQTPAAPLDNLGTPAVQTQEPQTTPSKPPETPQVQTTPVETPATPTEPAQTTPAATEPPAETPLDPWTSVFGTIKSDVGIEFHDKNQFVDELKQFNAYKQDPYGFLPEEIKAHAEFIKAGGNTQEFYRMKSVDFEVLPPKEILYQTHLKNNPDQAKDPEFARMYFERDYTNRYQIISDPKKTPQDFVDETTQEPNQLAYQQYLQEYTFAEKSLQFESDKSKQTLTEWQKQSTSPPASTGMTQEELDQYRNNHMQGVEQIKSSYNGEEIPISENPEENLKFGLTEQVKTQWEKDLINPMELFNELGLQNDGKVDLEKLSRASFKFRMWDQMGPIATKLILENNARQTVTGREINPATPTPTGEPGAVHQEDELKEVADLIIQKDFSGRPAY